MLRFYALAATAAAAVATVSSGEVTSTLLDIPDGVGTDIEWTSSAGLGGMPFVIASENLNFKRNNFATEGVVRAWDFENNANVRGVLLLTAAEGVEFTNLAFDLSGFKDYASVGQLKVKVNGEVWKDKTWSFDGRETLIQKDWILDPGATSIEIILKNIEGEAYHGLDNINISTVPAPGAVALLGVAGLAGRRRRRG